MRAERISRRRGREADGRTTPQPRAALHRAVRDNFAKIFGHKLDTKTFTTALTYNPYFGACYARSAAAAFSCAPLPPPLERTGGGSGIGACRSGGGGGGGGCADDVGGGERDERATSAAAAAFFAAPPAERLLSTQQPSCVPSE